VVMLCMIMEGPGEQACHSRQPGSRKWAGHIVQDMAKWHTSFSLAPPPSNAIILWIHQGTIISELRALLIKSPFNNWVHQLEIKPSKCKSFERTFKFKPNNWFIIKY
jgi:hypothetical protein